VAYQTFIKDYVLGLFFSFLNSVIHSKSFTCYGPCLCPHVKSLLSWIQTIEIVLFSHTGL
jgi:hypothetical protein